MIYTDRNHLTADTLVELTTFIEMHIARGSGERMNLGQHIYYPLSTSEAEDAIKNGANVVSTSEIVELSEKCSA